MISTLPGFYNTVLIDIQAYQTYTYLFKVSSYQLFLGNYIMHMIKDIAEEKILKHHLDISRDGFKALEKVTSFCCCGCGLCVSMCPLGSISINESTKKPQLTGKCNECGICYLACPRSFLPLSKIDAAYYGEGHGEEGEHLGDFVDLFNAKSLNTAMYREGTPGGTTTAMVNFLMESGEVDAALLTKGRHEDVTYCLHALPYIALTPQDVLLSSHTKLEISPILAHLKDLSKYQNTLFVGTPCQIMAVRKLQIISKDEVFRNLMKDLAELADLYTANISYAISINCFLNHTSIDKAYSWLGIEEKDILKFNENVSKDLYDKAYAEGKDVRWFFENNYVTKDGLESAYDVKELGVRVLPSGCLVCDSNIVSKHADASIGFFGAEQNTKEFGWNIVVLRNAQLKKVADKMVVQKKLEKRPVLRHHGRELRESIEEIIPTFDAMNVKGYLETGEWSYPEEAQKARGLQGTDILGLELLFLAQSFRQKMFHDAPVKILQDAGAYYTTIY
jgi:coenzyme F420-reducing hydrogenase beta subunit